MSKEGAGHAIIDPEDYWSKILEPGWHDVVSYIDGTFPMYPAEVGYSEETDTRYSIKSN